MVKIHGIEDHLLNKLIKYNEIGCFIENSIEQARQSEMIDERRTTNMRDIVKTSINYSKMESISWNGGFNQKLNKLQLILEELVINEIW